MTKLTLKDISEAMKDIDICMMTTKTPTMALESRPMSNNRQVDYDGDSYFFCNGDCSAVKEITAKPEVNLSYVHEPALLGKNMYISVTGDAHLHQDRTMLEKHWVKDLEVWFKDGLDTPGLTLIHVRATRIKYWKGYEEGEITLPNASMPQKRAM